MLRMLLSFYGTRFRWGTQRIKVYLEHPPDYIRFLLENVLSIEWSPVNLSREIINNVLKKHRRNGSPYGEKREWKYFRAEYPDQLWQVDIKGPSTIERQRTLALVIIDDNSRYLISCTLHASITADDVIETFNRVAQRGHKCRWTII